MTSPLSWGRLVSYCRARFPINFQVMFLMMFQVATLPVDMDLENWLESTGTKDESREEVGKCFHIVMMMQNPELK